MVTCEIKRSSKLFQNDLMSHVTTAWSDYLEFLLSHTHMDIHDMCLRLAVVLNTWIFVTLCLWLCRVSLITHTHMDIHDMCLQLVVVLNTGIFITLCLWLEFPLLHSHEYSWCVPTTSVFLIIHMNIHVIMPVTRICPYYTSKELKKEADIIFMPYNYLIDPKVTSVLYY